MALSMETVMDLAGRPTTSSSQVHELVSAVENLVGSKDGTSALFTQLRTLLTDDEHNLEDVVGFVRALFLGSPSATGAGSKRSTSIVQLVISLLESRLLLGRKATEIVAAVLVQLDAFKPKELAGFVESILTHWEQSQQSEGESAQILAKCMALLSRSETVPMTLLEGDETEPVPIAIQDYKTRIIARLCGAPWVPRTASSLAAEFRHVPLTDEQLRALVGKIISLFPSIDNRELPALAYQVLLLAGRRHRKLVLNALISHFEKLDAAVAGDTANAQLRHVEGALMMHVHLAATQDESLSREILKHLNVPLSPFSVALLLTVGQLQRHEEKVQTSLYSSVIARFRGPSATPSSVDAALLRCAENSRYGWDHLAPGIVQLGLQLLDSPGDRGPFDGGAGKRAGPLVAAFAKQLLLTVFKWQRSVRSRLLDAVMSRLLAGSDAVPRAVSLLNALVWSDIDVASDHAPKIREALDFLPHVPPAVATDLLLSILPLTRTSPKFLDSIVIVLRKCVFGKGVDSRIVALRGLVCLLVADAEAVPRTEIMGFLRRCLTQQPPVRRVLYEGLYSVAQAQPELEGAVVEMLVHQLRQHADLRLDACLDTATDESDALLLEPLPDLFLWSQRILRLLITRHNADGDAATAQLKAAVAGIAQRLSASSAEDFDLAAGTDFNAVAKLGRTNVMRAKLLLGLLKGALEFVVLSQEDAETERLKSAIQLYDTYGELRRRAAAKPADDGEGESATRKRGRPPQPIDDDVSLSLDLTVSLFRTLCVQKTRTHPSLSQFVLSTLLVQLAGLCEGRLPPDVVAPVTLSPDSMDRRAAFEQARGFDFVRAVAPLLWREALVGAERDKSDPVPAAALEGFEHCVRYVGGDEDHLAALLDTCELPGAVAAAAAAAGGAAAGDTGTGLSTATTSSPSLLRIDVHTRFLESASFSQLCDDGQWGQAECLLRVITGIITRHIVRRDRAVQAHLRWCLQFCTENPLPHLGLVRALTTLLLLLARLARDREARVGLANDLKGTWGDVVVEEDTVVQPEHALVNDKTAPTVFQALISSMDTELDDIDGVMAGLQAAVVTQSSEETMLDGAATPPPLRQARARVGQAADAVMTALSDLVSQLDVLSTTQIADMRDLEAFHRHLTRFYGKAMLTLTKHFISQGGVPPRNFVQLVATIAQHVTPGVYSVMGVCLKQDDNVSSARIGRQGRVIPNLIFAIEQYEMFLIKLGRATHTNLKRYMHRSTARDFRIDEEKVKTALEEASHGKKRGKKRKKKDAVVDDSSDSSSDEGEATKKKKKGKKA